MPSTQSNYPWIDRSCTMVKRVAHKRLVARQTVEIPTVYCGELPSYRYENVLTGETWYVCNAHADEYVTRAADRMGLKMTRYSD